MTLGKDLYFITGLNLIKYESKSKTVTKISTSASFNDWISK